MKRLALSVCIIALAASSVFSQAKPKQAAVPAAAKTAFEKAFPGASKIKWGKEKTDYEVNFVQKGQEMAAVYDAGGNLKETEVDIKQSALPQPVLDYIKQHYKGAPVKEAAKITKAGGEVNYEAEVNKKDVIFDATGKFLREEKDED
jgi:hypothetical protein